MLLHLFLLLLLLVLGLALRRAYWRQARLQEQLTDVRRQRKEVMDFLSTFTTSLATVKEMDRAMELVAHYLRESLEAESLCIFQMVEEEGEKRLQAVAVAGMFPPLQRTSNMVMAKHSYLKEHLRRERIPLGEGIIGGVGKSQQPFLVEDASLQPEAERLPRDVHSLMAVPMLIENRLAGVVCAVNCRQPDRMFTARDLLNFERLSGHAAFASNIVGIYAERHNQERITQELNLARHLQDSLLPKEVPQFGAFCVAAYTQSALEVGGDYYDFIPMDSNRMMVIVADATGKGVPACMLMAMCQSYARAAVEHFTMLEDFLREMNRFLYRNTDRSHYVTMGVLVLDRENNTCEYARGGHTPLLLRSPQGVVRVIKPRGSAPGALPEKRAVPCATFAFTFEPGTSIMLFTDGLTEALDEEDCEFGLPRLERLWTDFGHLPYAELTRKIMDEVKFFAGSRPQADDQTIMIVQRPLPETAVPPPAVTQPPT